MKNDPFGDRMKSYERVSENALMPRSPVIIRLDGKNFSSFTRKLKKPYSALLREELLEATRYLCNQMQGARLAYVQSDEVSILIYPRTTVADPWLGNRIQKMVSVSAGIFSAVFATNFLAGNSADRIPSFDARVFALPESEVANYFWWRQSDAIRNSVSMAARQHFSTKALHGKTVHDMKAMLREAEHPWEELDPAFCYGSVFIPSRGEVINALKGKEFTQEPLFLRNAEFFDSFLEILHPE